jgi:hypothetical protein
MWFLKFVIGYRLSLIHTIIPLPSCEIEHPLFAKSEHNLR